MFEVEHSQVVVAHAQVQHATMTNLDRIGFASQNDEDAVFLASTDTIKAPAPHNNMHVMASELTSPPC